MRNAVILPLPSVTLSSVFDLAFHVAYPATQQVSTAQALSFPIARLPLSKNPTRFFAGKTRTGATSKSIPDRTAKSTCADWGEATTWEVPV